MKNIVLASHNAGKIRELKSLLQNLALNPVPQTEYGVQDIEETGLTFIENALLKARHAAKASQLPAMADDSGLVVDALKGEPGIYSARYAGKNANARDNIEKLLVAMRDIPEEKRIAHFHCVIVFILHAEDPAPLICEGKWFGTILNESRGNEGFGYDPVFFIPSLQLTAAELPFAKKNNMSHRYQAIQLLIKQLPEKLCLLSSSTS